MAGFQVANFDFGKNIVDADLRRQQLAAQERASVRSAALQARGQDIAAAQNEAARAEQARQFDARMADSQAAREESARQFDNRLADASMARDESARQFDAGQSLREREFSAKRADAERTQSWDDAIKAQQMEAMELEFAKRNEELNRIMAIRQKEDEERAHQQELIDSAYGDAVIATELGGGFLSPGQIKDFNERNGTKYNYIGKVDPTTGKPFSDNKIHFLTYATDQNGAAVIDPQSKRPVLEDDLPIGQEFYGRTMDAYFGKFSNIMRGGTKSSSMSPERYALELKKLEQRQSEEEGRNARYGAKGDIAKVRAALTASKDLNNLVYSLGLSGEKADAFKASLANIITGGLTEEGGDKAPVKSGDNSGNDNTIQEFNPNGSYKVGDKFTRNGIVYEVGADGQPHRVK